ncbi:hypothetical protein [Pseudoteredinibacter isoporae]|uniref:Uncharacterized protein n=1 Tax=Pseudoteredinibacter isoporae TaxID=570281 RepID=A0A7X0MVZ8_9GAMM|nr:hypothetical protein [Pseudoteredinibacter isoporae]MBB6520369.1 hypothetical protein [Pseudoteredinibacter isoporae]NHO85939.1 hypothetical protein [Pseudoteredinibacter isoporae]NIB25609.1 hypothetical protein [Pseudoteredinibacter isoporae]
MQLWLRPLIYGILLSTFLLFLLPAVSNALFELYHLSKIEPLYYLYSGFKALSVYYPRWEFFEASAVMAGVLLALTIWAWRCRRSSS